jgi:glycosyltransferase involved in cell wall biosynthesis
MIKQEISDKVLTICPDFSNPKGGVAQCVATYNRVVFERFKTVCNSCSGSKFKKLSKCVTAIFRLVWTLAFDRNIKIVHIHTASYNSFKRSAVFVRIAKMMGRKVVLHIHGGGFKEYYSQNSAFVKNILDKCDALAVLSHSWKDFFDTIVAPDRVRVVPNIMEDARHIDVETDGKTHFLFFGQIYQAKGIFDLVELLCESKEEYRGKLVLDIGGGMFEVERLKTYIKDNDLGDIIHFHGWVSGDAKVRLLNLADAFILPSYVEGVPISILEAEVYGLPILSTPVGGIPEVVHDGENGYLFAPGDKKAMKAAIDSTLRDADLRAKMGEKSKMMVKDNLPGNIEKELSSLYKFLLSA